MRYPSRRVKRPPPLMFFWKNFFCSRTIVNFGLLYGAAVAVPARRLRPFLPRRHSVVNSIGASTIHASTSGNVIIRDAACSSRPFSHAEG